MNMGNPPAWYEFCSDVTPMARSLGFQVPAEVSADIHRIGQARVRVVVNGNEAQTVMLQSPGGGHFVKLSAAFRKAAGVREGDRIAVKLALREDEPDLEPPADLKQALDSEPAAKDRWSYLPYRQKKAHVDYISAADKPEYRARRIRKVVEALAG